MARHTFDCTLTSFTIARKNKNKQTNRGNIYLHHTAVPALLHEHRVVVGKSHRQALVNSRQTQVALSCHFTKFPTSTFFFFCQRLSLRPVATCSFISPSPLDFLQTLHVYCSHASHIVSSASDSSGGSPGFNHGECSSCVLTSTRGRFFQLAGIHVCKRRHESSELCVAAE